MERYRGSALVLPHVVLVSGSKSGKHAACSISAPLPVNNKTPYYNSLRCIPNLPYTFDIADFSTAMTVVACCASALPLSGVHAFSHSAHTHEQCPLCDIF